VYANCKSKRTNAPTVLIYSHYDVQPATKAGWDTDPFTPVNKQDGKDTRKYGRGAADDKSGIIMHLGLAQVFKSPGLPVNLKLIFEGEEETNFGTLEDYLNDPDTDHEPFKADLIVIADCGNRALGVPTLTTTLRGVHSRVRLSWAVASRVDLGGLLVIGDGVSGSIVVCDRRSSVLCPRLCSRRRRMRSWLRWWWGWPRGWRRWRRRTPSCGVGSG
jgi:hypothetical protein